MQSAARDAWANPASVHTEGRAARARVEEARAAVARLGSVDARDVLLTSGGTEANNLALRSAFPRSSGLPLRLLLSQLEHPSVTRVAEALMTEGLADLRWIRVSPEGTVDVDDLQRALSEGPVRLVALQGVNHETGVVQPIAETSRLARAHGALFHVDMVQAWGKVDVCTSTADTQSLAAHKIRGPKGIGALLMRPGVSIAPLLRGGAQEGGRRPGTVDPVSCVGLGLAADHAVTGVARYAAIASLRDDLEARLQALGGVVNGSGPRAPHVTNLSWPGWSGAELVAALDLEGLAVSSGSACSAGTSDPSPVLKAMVGELRAASAVRFSLGETSTMEDVLFAEAALRRVLAR
jgi:cysteine desulfurase